MTTTDGRLWARRAALAALALACVLFTARTLRAIPVYHNWDALGYMALTLEWELDDPEEVHRRTYAEAQRVMPPAAFAELVSAGSEVRRERYRDPQAFTEHLAFYRARVFGTLSLWLLHRAGGVELALAPWVLTLGSLIGLGLLALLWLGGRIAPWAALVGATALLHAPPLLMNAMLSTVDAQASLITCLGLFVFLERRRPMLGAALTTLAILTRPDTVILVGCFAVAAFLFQRNDDSGRGRLSVRFLAAWLGVSVATYLGVQAYAGEYGWWPLFQITFVEKAVHPAALPTTPDPGVYLDVLAERLARLPGAGYLRQGRFVPGTTFPFVFAGFGVLGLALWQRLDAARRSRLALHAALLAALVPTYLVRWLLFPALWDRLFVPLYVLIPLVLVSMVCVALDRDPDPDPVTA